MEIESLIFESKTPDRGFTIRASSLKEPNTKDALIEVFRNGEKVRQFTWPSYKVWNLAAHFGEIVSGEIEGHLDGYAQAGWDGISGAVDLNP
jgi:hypothetical protein